MPRPQPSQTKHTNRPGRTTPPPPPTIFISALSSGGIATRRENGEGAGCGGGGQPGGNGDGLRVRDTDNSTAVDDLPTATPTCHLSSWRIVESRNHDRQSLRQTDGGRQTSSADAFELTDRAV